MPAKNRIQVVMPADLVARLDAAAEADGQSRSHVLCDAARDWLARRGTEDAAGETMPAEAYRDMAAQASALARQLDSKDVQIAALTDALKASQALHAAALGLDSGKAEAGEGRPKPGRWARLRAAWRG